MGNCIRCKRRVVRSVQQSSDDSDYSEDLGDLLYHMIPGRNTPSNISFEVGTEETVNKNVYIEGNTCGICAFEYDSNEHFPKLLPCGHIICYYCMKNIGRKVRFLYIECPWDRKTHHVKGSNAGVLSRTRRLLDPMEILDDTYSDDVDEIEDSPLTSIRGDFLTVNAASTLNESSMSIPSSSSPFEDGEEIITDECASDSEVQTMSLRFVDISPGDLESNDERSLDSLKAEVHKIEMTTPELIRSRLIRHDVPELTTTPTRSRGNITNSSVFRCFEPNIPDNTEATKRVTVHEEGNIHEITKRVCTARNIYKPPNVNTTFVRNSDRLGKGNIENSAALIGSYRHNDKRHCEDYSWSRDVPLNVSEDGQSLRSYRSIEPDYPTSDSE